MTVERKAAGQFVEGSFGLISVPSPSAARRRRGAAGSDLEKDRGPGVAVRAIALFGVFWLRVHLHERLVL